VISVRTSELHRFAEEVRFEAAEVLSPAIVRFTLPLLDGVAFGAGAGTVSETVHAAQLRYAACLRASLGNLVAYIETAKGLADAAESVAASLEAADGRSAETIVLR
jgi:hypothetical protein